MIRHLTELIKNEKLPLLEVKEDKFRYQRDGKYYKYSHGDKFDNLHKSDKVLKKYDTSGRYGSSFAFKQIYFLVKIFL